MSYFAYPEMAKADIDRLGKYEPTGQERGRGDALVGGFKALKSMLVQGDAMVADDHIEVNFHPGRYGLVVPASRVGRTVTSADVNSRAEPPSDFFDIEKHGFTDKPFLIAKLGFVGLDDLETLWREPDPRSALRGYAESPVWVGRRNGVPKRLAYGYDLDWSDGHGLAVIAPRVKLRNDPF